MDRYHVHIYAHVRIKVAGVEASSPEMAIRSADNAINRAKLLNINCLQGRDEDDLKCEVSFVEDAEGTDGFLVDVVGDDEYEKTRWYEADGRTPLKKGKSRLERSLDLVTKLASELRRGHDTHNGCPFTHSDGVLAKKFLEYVDLARETVDYPSDMRSQYLCDQFISKYGGLAAGMTKADYACRCGSSDSKEIEKGLFHDHGIVVYYIGRPLTGEVQELVYCATPHEWHANFFVHHESQKLLPINEVLNLIRAG